MPRPPWGLGLAPHGTRDPPPEARGQLLRAIGFSHAKGLCGGRCSSGFWLCHRAAVTLSLSVTSCELGTIVDLLRRAQNEIVRRMLYPPVAGCQVGTSSQRDGRWGLSQRLTLLFLPCRPDGQTRRPAPARPGRQAVWRAERKNSTISEFHFRKSRWDNGW